MIRTLYTALAACWMIAVFPAPDLRGQTDMVRINEFMALNGSPLILQ